MPYKYIELNIPKMDAILLSKPDGHIISHLQVIPNYSLSITEIEISICIEIAKSGLHCLQSDFHCNFCLFIIATLV